MKRIHLFLTVAILMAIAISARGQSDNLDLDTATIQLLLDEGEQLMNSSNPQGAKIKLQLADSLSAGRGCFALRAKVQQTLGRCLGRLGEYDDAISILRLALDCKIELFDEEHLEVAAAKISLGYYLAQNQQLDSTLVYYYQALDAIQKKEGEKSERSALVLNNIGNVYIRKGDQNKAEQIHQRVLDIRLEVLAANDPGLAQSYMNIAELYSNKGLYKEANDLLEKSLYIYLKKYGGTDYRVANVYNNIGNNFQKVDQLDSALYYLKKGTETRVAVYGKEHVYVGYSYINMGALYNKMYEIDKAIKYNERAIGVIEKALGKEHSILALPYGNLARNYTAKGDIKKAIEYYDYAIRLRKNGKEVDTELWQSYRNVCEVYVSTGQYQKAKLYINEALNLLQETGRDRDIAHVKMNLGSISLEAGESQEGHKQLQAARSMYQNLGENASPSDLIELYGNLGVAKKMIGEVDSAIYFYKKAIAYADNKPQVRYNTISRYRNLGNRWTEAGKLDSALWAFKQSVEISREAYHKSGERVELIRGFNALSLFHCDLGNLEQALVYGDSALFYNHYLPDKDFKNSNLQLLLQSLARKVLALKRQYDQTNEEDSLWGALAVIDSMDVIASKHLRAISNEPKSLDVFLRQLKSFEEIKLSTFHAALYLDGGYEEAFLRGMERSKSLQLYQAMQKSDALAYSGIPDSLLQREYHLRLDLTYYDNKRVEELRAGSSETESDSKNDLQSKLFSLHQSYDSLLRHFESEYPEYYKLKYDLGVVTTTQIRSGILEKDQALLEYFVGDSTLFLMLVTKEDQVIKEIKMDFPLRDWVWEMRANISQPFPFAYESYLDVAPKLYNKLIAPVADKLPKKLLIVPDDFLGYLPFEALLTSPPKREDTYAAERLPYLIRKHQVSYSYSATLLQEIQQKQHREVPVRTLFALAPYAELDTVLSSHLDLSNGFASLRSDTLVGLPFTKVELDSIQTIFATDALYGEEATKEVFASFASKYRILHLSTHGKADSRVGDFSYLAFYPQPDSLDNELLFVRDIYNLDLNADLVMLSACETAIGELKRGEGIISLARAFAYAGAKSIFTTLWRVNDQSTYELTVSFYRYLKAGLSKDAALRQAKLDYLDSHSDIEAYPFFWAALIGVGDMSKL